MTEMERRQKGASYPAVNDSDVRAQLIPLPPLPEQKRIVALLDEVFAGITKAVANAEKNLTNVRELFNSYLNNVFTQKGDGWVEKRLGDICNLIGGGTPSKKNKDFYKGNIFWATVRDMNEDTITRTEFKITEEAVKKSSTNIIKAGNVVIATRVGLGKVCFINQNTAINQDLRGIEPINSEMLAVRYLFWWLKSIAHLIEDEGTGATVKGVKLPFVKSLQIPLPPLLEQKRIVAILETLREETQRLETIYQQKLTALAELKQSILQKAFSGELTSEATTSPDFSAKILAFAYDRHATKKREKTFGRVKAQKILHLAESIGGIDLGRNPLKDAAGPNDFKHMLKAEEWAKENLLFEFREREKGYDFIKLSRYNDMKDKVLSTIRPYRKELEKVVDLLIPMNSQEAEVFATVHAAWNNLILDGQEFDDKKIIHEARDNWHSDKMTIPESKFRKAIRLIRDKGLVPDGRAKRVTGEERLL